MYITKMQSVYSKDEPRLFAAKYPQYGHWVPESYEGTKSNRKYVPHNLVNMALAKDNFSEDVKQAATVSDGNATVIAGGSTLWCSIGQNHSLLNDGENDNYHRQYNNIPKSIINTFAGSMANRLGYTDHIMVEAETCMSTIKAMWQANALMKLEGTKRVLIISVEDTLNPATYAIFAQSRTNLPPDLYESGILPSAFDEVNGGFCLGQGANVMLVESAESLEETGNKPIAHILSAVVGGEKCNTPIGMDPNGVGYSNAISKSLERAELNPSDIDLVKTHGTGTLHNNIAEKAAMDNVLGDYRATAYKPIIGHTMGASVGVELSLILEEAKQGQISGIRNCSNPSEKFLTDHLHDMEVNHVLLNAAGFGNIYGAAIVKVIK